MFRFSGSFIILVGLRSSVPPTASICTLFRCPSFSWWCRDPGPCARWVCVVLSFNLVGGHPPCGPHGFWFTPFVHFCTRDPVGHWSALHTCQPSDPIFKSYRIRFSLSVPPSPSGFRSACWISVRCATYRGVGVGMNAICGVQFQELNVPPGYGVG